MGSKSVNDSKGGEDMDGLNELGTFISSVGFPIAASVGIFYLYNKTIKELTVTLEKIGDGVQQLLDRGNKNGND